MQCRSDTYLKPLLRWAVYGEGANKTKKKSSDTIGKQRWIRVWENIFSKRKTQPILIGERQTWIIQIQWTKDTNLDHTNPETKDANLDHTNPMSKRKRNFRSAEINAEKRENREWEAKNEPIQTYELKNQRDLKREISEPEKGSTANVERENSTTNLTKQQLQTSPNNNCSEPSTYSPATSRTLPKNTYKWATHPLKGLIRRRVIRTYIGELGSLPSRCGTRY